MDRVNPNPNYMLVILPSRISAFQRQRQADLCKFEPSLVYSEFQDRFPSYRETLPQKNYKKRKEGREGWRKKNSNTSLAMRETQLLSFAELQRWLSA